MYYVDIIFNLTL